MLDLAIPPTVAAPAAARSEVLAWLGHGAYPGMETEIVELLVSELVTNSVRHAEIAPHDLLRLTASVRAGRLRIAVHDHGVVGNVARRDGPRLGDGGGYGLDLVAQLSSAWGIERDGDGTTVWLELLAPPHATETDGAAGGA